MKDNKITNCAKCNSDRIIRHGESISGWQQYRCKSCGFISTGNKPGRKPIGDHVLTVAEINKRSIEKRLATYPNKEEFYAERDRNSVELKQCFHCGSKELTKNGRNARGYRQYKCKNCNRTRSARLSEVNLLMAKENVVIIEPSLKSSIKKTHGKTLREIFREQIRENRLAVSLPEKTKV